MNNQPSASTEDKEKKNRNRRMDKELKQIQIFIAMGNMQLDRLQKIEDPVLKHHFVVQILSTMFLMMPEIFKMITLNDLEEDADEQNQNKIQQTEDNLNKLSEKMGKYLDELAHWIIQPHYSPDHPFGQHYMKTNAGNHFEKQQEKEREEKKD